MHSLRYTEKLDGDIHQIGLVIRALISRLPDDQVKQYLAIVSDEMTTIQADQEFRYNLHLLPPQLWGQLPEIPRLRMENRVIRAIGEGQSVNGDCRRGARATWAGGLFRYFTLKDQVGTAFIEKLQSNLAPSRHYVVEWFLFQLPSVILSPYRVSQCVRALSKSIREGDETMHNAVIQNIGSLPDEWQKEFVGDLKDRTDARRPEIYLPDGTPFLKSNEPDYPENENADIPVLEDDIPF